MVPGDIVSVEVTGIVPGGAGIARHQGRALFVRHSAPGDRVRVRIRRVRGSWAEAAILEILEASPRRVRPRCPLRSEAGTEGCGGCSFQHLDYGFQREAKAAMLRESFGRLGGLSWETPRVLPSSPWEYRNRVQFHAVRSGGETPPRAESSRAESPRVGFKSSGGAESRVIPVHDCPIADPGIRALLRSGELEAPAGRDRFTVYSREGMTLREDGRSRGRVRLRDRELLMDAGLFFQSNAAMLELLIGDLVRLAAAADRSLPLADLYSGVGTFAAFLSPCFPRTELLEENRAALALARQNVDSGDYKFHALTDNEWVKIQESERQAPRYGLIVADPPRQGLSPPLRRWLARGPAPLLAYVSCDPATLARDSGELVRGAWELVDLACYDFYPQTAHIESLALFRNRHDR